MRIYLGSYFKIPFYVHLSCVAFVAVVGLIFGLQHFGVTCLVYLFVSLHEYGHCLMAKHLNVEVRSVTLYPTGGIALMNFDPTNARQELLITLAGPAVNFVLAIAAFPLLFLTPHVNQEWFTAGVVLTVALNLLLGVFNLIPAIPMDGGRIFRSILNWTTSDYYKSTYIAARTSQVLSVMLIVAGIYMGVWMWLLLFTVMIALAEREWANAQSARAMSNVRIKVATLLDRPDLLDAPLSELISALEGVTDEEVKDLLLLDDLLPVLKDLQGVSPSAIYKP